MPGHLYHKTTSFYLIRDAKGAVKKLIFLVYHSQYMLQGADYNRGAYNDLVLNAVAGFAGQSLVRHDANVHYTGTTHRVQPPRQRVSSQKRYTTPSPTVLQQAHDTPQPQLGGKPTTYDIPRAVCYHVDHITKEAYDTCYSQKGWLKKHVLDSHPGLAWDANLIKWEAVGVEGAASGPAAISRGSGSGSGSGLDFNCFYSSLNNTVR